jgi:hypothetical protein
VAKRAGRAAADRDLGAAAYRSVLALAGLAGLWLTRRGATATVPAGSDFEAHVARTDFALHLFGQGRMDGWFPTFGSGYRLFAVYGPGLAVASGLLKLVTFGLLGTSRSLALLGALSVAALPAAVATLSRELGSSRLAAAIHGSLALLISFPYGGGLDALYGPGLVPQTLAIPLQVLVLAGLLRIVRTGSWRSVAVTALGIAGLLVLHPISLLILLVMVPGLVFALPRPWLRVGFLRAAAAGGWGALIAAWWLVPAWRTRASRGGVSSWNTPTLPTRLGEIADGRALQPQLLTLLVALSIAMLGGAAIGSSSARRRLAVPATAVVFLVLAHLAVGHRWGPKELYVQFANRGLALAAYLLLLPVAVVAADLLVRHLPERVSVAVIAAVAVALIGFAGPLLMSDRLRIPQVAPPPTPDLAATARTLRHVVPPDGRFLLAEPSPFVPLGTAEPTRWLAVHAHRITAQLYFAEATNHPGAGVLPGRFLQEAQPADALGPLRRAGISHVVVTAPIPSSQLDHQPGYRLTSRHGSLAVYEVEPEASAPVVTDLLQPDDAPIRPIGFHLTARLRAHDAERYRWSTDAPDAITVVAPVASDPGWHATVDGRRVPTSASEEGLVRFRLPAGHHRVDLHFVGSRNDPVGIVLTLVALGGAIFVVRPARRPRGSGGQRSTAALRSMKRSRSSAVSKPTTDHACSTPARRSASMRWFPSSTTSSSSR